MFPQLESKIEYCRKSQGNKVPTLLGLLSRAEKASYSGDHYKAARLVAQAMKL